MGSVLAIPFGYLVYKLSSTDEGLIHILKEFIAFWYITSWKRKSKRIDLYDYENTSDLYKLGLKLSPEEWRLECPRKSLDFSESIDSIQFYGVNSKNESLFVRISKISQNLASIWLQLGMEQNKTYTLPVEKEWKIPRTGEDCFAAGGLRIRCLVPMRRWRISYNGILTETAEKKTENVHVKLNLIWVAGKEPYDLMNDISSKQLARFLARQRWGAIFPPDLNRIMKYLDSYDQFGNIIGTVSVASADEQELHLWGTRNRSTSIHDSHSPTELVQFFGYLKDGESFHVGQAKFPNLNSELQYGYISHSNGLYFMLDECDIRAVTTKGENGTDVVQSASLLFQKRKEDKEIQFGRLFSTAQHVERGRGGENVMMLQWSPVNFCCETGQGLIMTTHKSHKIVRTRTMTTGKSQSSSTKISESVMVVPLQDLGEEYFNIAGGKGASLGKLTALGLTDKNVSVPKGLVVTTAAYDEFLRNSGVTRENIGHLQAVSSGKINGVLHDVCQNTVKDISNEELPEKIQLEIRSALQKLFSDAFHTIRFAVRSSATGEDSEEMSAAGQMETFLGIQGFQEITKAVVKCWASQFSFTAIQYKRQYGQLLNSPMAIVIQEMVPAYVAGVIFTCDPLTGNPGIITLTANYGIGESVVSGSADPDTVTLHRDVISGKVTLDKMQVGQKKSKIVMSEVNSGVEEKKVDPTDSEHCCLSKSMATALAELAVKIEDEYACPMDIEWAMKSGKIYLLQARPVTTFDKETDFEIIHENDTFLQNENEYVTIANIGEVMPGAFSYLSMSHMITQWNIMSTRIFSKRNPNMNFTSPYSMKLIYINSQRYFLNVAEFILRFHVKEDSFMSNGNIISIFGRLLDDKEMFDMALKRNSNYLDTWKSSALIQLFFIIKDMLTVGKKIRKYTEKIKSFEINLNHCKDLEDMLDEIRRQTNNSVLHGQIEHMHATAISSIWNMLLLYILQTASGSWNSEVFSDFSSLLSSISNIESAQVPSAMQNISISISKCIQPSIFCAMKVQDALKWIEESKVGNEFRTFLQNHGHRSINEFDIRIKTWGMDPLPLVKILQAMVANSSVIEKNSQQKKTKPALKTPLSFARKIMLKILLPFVRRGVANRESGKSLMMHVVHKFRNAFRKLAKQMVIEGRLPDEDLMYFLTGTELEQLLKTRSPRLVQKAIRRRAIFPQLEALEFPEISKGHPRPINLEQNDEENDATLTVKGVPVSCGIAKGPARVAKTLEEASHIKQGEILIAHSTDIGWSPYFPLLAGVCTELGGLISHGAVVAREYGLPCVVSVNNATKIFKTGDMVLIDGSKGFLQKLE